MDPVMLWIIAGLVLIVGEMLTGTFYILFLAIGAFAAALAAHLQQPVVLQAAVCGVVAILGVFVLRKPLQNKMLKNADMKTDIGSIFKVDQAITTQSSGRVPYQGTTWPAKNIGDVSLNSGDEAIIVGLDGNILLIKKK